MTRYPASRFKWTVCITTDTGYVIDHGFYRTRQRARDEVKALRKCDVNGKIEIRRTWLVESERQTLAECKFSTVFGPLEALI